MMLRIAVYRDDYGFIDFLSKRWTGANSHIHDFHIALRRFRGSLRCRLHRYDVAACS